MLPDRALLTNMLRLSLLPAFAALVSACAKDHNDIFHVKRDVMPKAPFPPELTAEESLLVNSFDNASIASSSYYYTHGLHVAGTNRSMAQWTADRWAENGFDSRLVEYCTNITTFMRGKANLNRCIHQLPAGSEAHDQLRRRDWLRLQFGRGRD